jgi:hypothetical protein
MVYPSSPPSSLLSPVCAWERMQVCVRGDLKYFLATTNVAVDLNGDEIDFGKDMKIIIQDHNARCEHMLATVGKALDSLLLSTYNYH